MEESEETTRSSAMAVIDKKGLGEFQMTGVGMRADGHASGNDSGGGPERALPRPVWRDLAEYMSRNPFETPYSMAWLAWVLPMEGAHLPCGLRSTVDDAVALVLRPREALSHHVF